MIKKATNGFTYLPVAQSVAAAVAKSLAAAASATVAPAAIYWNNYKKVFVRYIYKTSWDNAYYSHHYPVDAETLLFTFFWNIYTSLYK